MIKKGVFKNVAIYMFFILTGIFFICGCALIGGSYQKEAKEEKQIFAFLKGYNHRIKGAQDCLVRAGFNPGPLDGEMHRSTRRAIKEFQKANGLTISGFIDNKTWEKLSSCKSIGTKDPLKYYTSSSGGIKELQQALKKAGFNPGIVDGKMGSRTKRAILDFQTAKGLKPDGVIDSKTIAELGKYFTKK